MKEDKNTGKLINPVQDIIPCDIWNNLPDVLKEKIIEAANIKNNYSFAIKRCSNIGYNPDKDTITIHRGSGTVSYIDTYDAKRGVLISAHGHCGL